MVADDHDETSPAEPELGAGSLWFLRIGAAAFLIVLAWFLVDAIIG